MDRLPEIRELFEYNGWANSRLLDAASNLSQEDYARDVRSSFPSIHHTLVHILGAEWIWLSRWQGTSPRAAPPHGATKTLEALRGEWSGVETAQRSFITQLTAERLDEIVSYTNLAGEPFAAPLWQMLRHVVNHSTYHRGQLATILRQLGSPAPATDLIVFYRARSSGS